MAREQVTVRLLVPGAGGQEEVHIIHGRIEDDGLIHHTSVGRGPQDHIISDFSHVAEIHEHANGLSNEQRIVVLGPNILYVYDETLKFKNESGQILMGASGFSGQETWEPISPSLELGGSFPRTIFQASDEAGFQIVH